MGGMWSRDVLLPKVNPRAGSNGYRVDSACDESWMPASHQGVPFELTAGANHSSRHIFPLAPLPSLDQDLMLQQRSGKDLSFSKEAKMNSKTRFQESQA